MASGTVKDEILKLLEKLNNRVEQTNKEMSSLAKGSLDSWKNNLLDSTCTAYNRIFEIYDESVASTSEALQLKEVWKYRDQFIADHSLAKRINMTLWTNLPIFLLSKGLRRIRNPIVFTTIASLVVLPEIINPFNRS
jgi:hypothetical protein